MTAFVKTCQQFVDIDSNNYIIEVNYTKYTEGIGIRSYTDEIKTKLLGNADFLDFKNDIMKYEDFLDIMIEKTIETMRKMVLIELDNVMLENKNINLFIRIMNTIKILDPTFIPPVINKMCSWQKRYVIETCKKTLPQIIKTSTSKYRLNKMFKILKLIEIEIE
tara:strand:- start:852 stop:1343 length:492 start_codon:yes stop_codon:yes gene_type:complete